MSRHPSWSDDLMAQVANQEDREKLRTLADMAQEAEDHLRRVRGERLRVAKAMRDEGVAMIDIAKWAGVSDSYLTRTLLKAGALRRVGRRL